MYSQLARVARKLAGAFQRKKLDRDLAEEMETHRTLVESDLGNRHSEEQESAAKLMGNITLMKEESKDAWAFQSFENFFRDLRYASRTLIKSPGFTAVAVVTLALGIGAATAMFSVIDNVLLEPFPYAHQHRLFSVVIHDSSSSEPGGRTLLPPTEFLDYQEQNRIFDEVMGVAISRALWTTGGTPESVNAPLVTPNAFQFLGVPALLGRVATPADLQPESPPVCVMSYSFWKSRFASDPRILGKTLTLDGTPRTVVGVMPSRFIFWSADVWLPTLLRRDANGFPPPWFYLLGRLKNGVTVDMAEWQIQMVAERLALKYRPNLYPARFNVSLESFADASVGKFRRTLFTLLAAVGLLLAIACANVANLLLARASTRKRELAVRTSLGAGWWRIVRQLFLESGLLALLAAAGGCAFAWGGLKLLVAILPQDTFPEEAVIGLNLRVLVATLGLAVGTALFFGLIPVLSGLRRDVNEALRSAGREHSGFRRSRLRNLLIICEVAISLVLLSAAGVMMRSFLREREVPLGVNSEHVLGAEVYLTKGHRTVEQQAVFNREFTAALRQVPGVLDVATTTDFLPFGGASTQFEISGNTNPGQPTGQVAMIDPSLFRTLAVPFLRGRNLTESDVAGKHMLAVVNHTFAEKFFAGEDAVGRQIQVTTLTHLPEPVPNPWFQIVGVTADFKNHGLRQPVAPEVFIPYSVSGLGGFSVLVRTTSDPRVFGRKLEATALTLDGSTVVRHIRTIQQALEVEEYAKPRFSLEIFSVFGALGILLVSAGLYSVMSYAVSQRRREMGIRVALGASSGDVQALVIRTGMRVVTVGILAGLLCSFVLLRLIESQVWGISTHDPLTLSGVILILIVVGVSACYVPSLAATWVDPAETLRSE